MSQNSPYSRWSRTAACGICALEAGWESEVRDDLIFGMALTDYFAADKDVKGKITTHAYYWPMS